MDDTHVYWRDELDSGIYRCPLAGCVPADEPEPFATDQNGQVGANLALDDHYVYWAASSVIRRRRK